MRAFPKEQGTIFDLIFQLRFLGDVDAAVVGDPVRFPAGGTFSYDVGFHLFLFIDPNPKPVHKPTPAKKQDDMDPIGHFGGIDALFLYILNTGNVGIVICPGSEIISLDKPEMVSHYPQGANQNGHNHEDRDHFESFFFSFSHYLKRSRTGTSKTTPERRNHTAKKVRAILKVWPMM